MAGWRKGRKNTHETIHDVARRPGISSRSFLKFYSPTAAALGFGPQFAPKAPMETKSCILMLWAHGLEYTCCSESFIRPAQPLAKDVILSMISHCATTTPS